MNIFLFPLSGLTSDLNSYQRIEPTDPGQTMFYHSTEGRNLSGMVIFYIQ